MLSSVVAANVSQFQIPTPNSYPESVAVGPDGNLWFTEKRGNKIGRLTPLGESGSDKRQSPQGIVSGPDGNLWFTQSRGNKIGRITVDGEITEFPLSSPESYPHGITVGSDGAIWFTLSGTDKIGRITLLGQLREYSLPRTRTPYGIASGGDGNLWFTGVQQQHGRAADAGRRRDGVWASDA